MKRRKNWKQMPDAFIRHRIALLKEEVDYAKNLTEYNIPLKFIVQRQDAITRLERLLK